MDDTRHGKLEAWLATDGRCEVSQEQANGAVRCDGTMDLQCPHTCRCRRDAFALVVGQEQLRRERGKLNWEGDLDQMRRDDIDT